MPRQKTGCARRLIDDQSLRARAAVGFSRDAIGAAGGGDVLIAAGGGDVGGKISFVALEISDRGLRRGGLVGIEKIRQRPQYFVLGRASVVQRAVIKKLNAV